MDTNFSLARIILLTYVIIASNYCTNLFSNGLKKAIEENRLVQHLILLILIMSLLIIFENPFGLEFTNDHTINLIIMTLLIYVWFIMTTKLDLAWNISILVLLTIYFLYESRQISQYKVIIADNNLDLLKKNELLNSFKNLQNYLLLGIFGITLVGTFFYAKEKQEQYSNINYQSGGGYNNKHNSFNMYKFFFE
jgi:hypothetical protein